MKLTLLISLLALPLISLAQTGGIVLSFSSEESDESFLEPIEVEFLKDSTFYRKDTVEGRLVLRGLPVGELRIRCTYKGKSVVQNRSVRVQENQLVYSSFIIDTKSKARQDNLGITYELTAAGGSSQAKSDALPVAVNVNAYAAKNPSMYVSGNNTSLSLDEVSITSYKTALINHNACAQGVVITKEDILRFPTRTVSEIASTVGGISLQEGTGNLHMRGSRSDANAYYIDGIRVRGSSGIPKSYIQRTTVYTGGLPAKYGDATGAVIAIESKFTAESAQVRQRNREIRNGTYHSPDDYLYVPKDRLSVDHFSEIYENDFLSPLEHPNSTFGIDVDQASWDYVKAQFKRGEVINRDAVKLEEMINSFKQKEVKIEPNELIGVEIERNNCSWNPESELVSIRLRARDLPKDLPRPSHNIVLLVDVSGSMSDNDKLPLLVKGFTSFIKSLDKSDRIAIVTYAGYSGVVLEPTECSKKAKIIKALEQLVSGGSTNGIGGIQTAYELAEKHYDPQLNNRIILATDGDFNVGISSTSELESYIVKLRGKGIYLTALGFGMGNYKSSILETLADRGDGNHFYINNLKSCTKVLEDNMGNLINMARDVKLNVEFNPRLVKEYRLIGYENRLMPSKDFDDDRSDGGEMGYGHTVSAVYEIKLGKDTKEKTHFTTTRAAFGNDELAFVKMRYKPLEDSTSVQRKYSLKENTEINDAPLINLIVSFGLHLRNSAFKGVTTNKTLISQAKSFKANNEEEAELRSMILALKKKG